MVEADDSLKPMEVTALVTIRYMLVGRPVKIGVLLASIISISSSLLAILLSMSPLYSFNGVLLKGSIGLLTYTLVDQGGLVRLCVLESLNNITVYIPLVSLISILLVLPSIMYLPRRGIPRVVLEVTAAGYVLNALALALLFSSLRVLYGDIIPSIISTLSRNTRLTTSYSVLYLYGVNGWYTSIGLLSLKLWYAYLPVSLLLMVSAVALIYYVIKYYEEILELPPVYHHS